MIPFEEYAFDITFALFNLRQLKASCWFELVKFLFVNILAFGTNILDPSKFLNFFVLYRICLLYFWFINVMMVLFELLPWDFLMWWQSSVVMGDLKASSFVNYNNGKFKMFIWDIVKNSSYFIQYYFFQSYCSTEFVDVSRIMILCFKFAIVCLN